MILKRKQLHKIIDLAEDDTLEEIYKNVIKFMPEDDALQDEIESHIEARNDFENGNIFSEEDINWD